MILELLLAAPLSPSPNPSPTSNPAGDLTPSQAAAPGVWAFVAFLFLAIALWLLMRNMNARLRRMSYRQKAAEGQAPHQPDVPARSPRAESDAVVERDGRSDVVREEREDR